MKNASALQDLKSVLSILLKDLRKNAGLTQMQVADALGYTTAQFVSNWERGVSTPPIESFPVLAKLYQVSQDTFTSVVGEIHQLKAERREAGAISSQQSGGNFFEPLEKKVS